MNRIFKKFNVRVTIAIMATILTVVLLSDVLVYRFAMRSEFEGLRTQLEVIAQTASLIMDADKVAAIPLNKEGLNTAAYAYANDQLRKIKAANPQIRYIYVLTKVDKTNIWRFVLDNDIDTKHGGRALPGTSYDAGRFPELLRALDRPSADQKIETDEWGSTLSGYAPIRNASGQPIAVLGVDMLADDVYAIERQVRDQVIVILLVGIGLAMLIGFFISRRVSGPVARLIVGTRYIAEGNFHHQVSVSGDDEISELALSLNNMAQSLQMSRQKLINYFYDTVQSLVTVLEIRDHYTLGHSESVANYASRIAERMGISGATLEMFRRVALLHDIGKVGVRDSVLLKADKLTDDEWKLIKLHPVLGEQILKPILDDPLMLAVIRNHHERYDGKGYPDGLSREQIPLMVAIVTVADCYDAMTSSRAYRKAMSKQQAMEQLRINRGTQFNPDVVDVFLRMLEQEEEKERTA